MRSAILAAIVAALSSTLVASPIAATPVHYEESVSGDLPWPANPLATFTLDVGANTIAGTEAIFGAPPGQFFDFDGFVFIVPAGTQLLAGEVQLADDVGDVERMGWDLRSGSVTSSGEFLEQVGGDSPGVHQLGTVPLGPGTYNFTPSAFATVDRPGIGDYIFTLTLRASPAVPEPGTLPLLALGVAGLSVARRRRHSR